MSMSQREMDIAQLEAELRIRLIFEEWQRGFLKGRLPSAPEEEIPVLPEVGTEEGSI